MPCFHNSSHGQVSSMTMISLIDGEYIEMSGRSAVRVIWIGNAYCLLISTTTFQRLAKSKSLTWYLSFSVVGCQRLLIFIIIFHIFIISSCVSINRVTCSSSNPFSSIDNISMSVNSSNSTLVFSKGACQTNSGDERNFAWSRS